VCLGDSLQPSLLLILWVLPSGCVSLGYWVERGLRISRFYPEWVRW